MWWKLTIAIILTTFTAQAQSPTIIEAVANTPDGKKNISIVEQPADAPNPLGNPIVGPYVAPQAYNAADSSNNTYTNTSSPSVEQPNVNTSLPQQSLELGKQFKDTLMEAGGEIYDIQSYPVQDINVIGDKINPQTIYSPNVNN